MILYYIALSNNLRKVRQKNDFGIKQVLFAGFFSEIFMNSTKQYSLI